MNDYIKKINKKSSVNIVRPIEEKDLINTTLINDKYLDLKSVKFVPASGAATRMFSHLYTFLDNKVRDKNVSLFLDNIEKFAFYEDIKDQVKKLNEYELVEYVLKSGLNYGNLPKALIKMHKYDCVTSNPIDEHIYEAKEYLNKDHARIHFTISPDHEKLFNDYINSIKADLGSIEIDYSFQDKATDAMAIDEFNNPFIKEDGQILYRPAGHGALLQNLNSIEADLIFIKNIDNVCHRSHVEDTIISKKRLASIGINLKAKIDKYIIDLLQANYNLEEIKNFIKDVLKVESYEELDKDKVLNILDRPLRIAGVVRNQGEPGGGPFIVDDGIYTSPQIVEMSEIDLSLYGDAVKNSKYFNPVDMVCFVKRYNGEKYNLLDYINHDRYIVVEKTYEGKKIKSLEYPGLWNGSMHYWNTVFVEIPITTFNPVKTVNDLLRDKHIGK